MKQYFWRLSTTSACVRRLLDAVLKFQKCKLSNDEDKQENGGNTHLDLSCDIINYDDIKDEVAAARAQRILPEREDDPPALSVMNLE